MEKKRDKSSGLAYWFSAGSGLSLVVGAKKTLILSSDVPRYPVTDMSGPKYPQGFEDFRSKTLVVTQPADEQLPVLPVVSCWLENPDALINSKLAEFSIPFELPAKQLFLNLYSVEDYYKIIIQIQFADALQARGFASLLSLARNFVSPQTISAGNGEIAPTLFDTLPVIDSDKIILESGNFSANYLALLIAMFSVK